MRATVLAMLAATTALSATMARTAWAADNPETAEFRSGYTAQQRTVAQSPVAQSPAAQGPAVPAGRPGTRQLVAVVPALPSVATVTAAVLAGPAATLPMPALATPITRPGAAPPETRIVLSPPRETTEPARPARGRRKVAAVKAVRPVRARPAPAQPPAVIAQPAVPAPTTVPPSVVVTTMEPAPPAAPPTVPPAAVPTLPVPAPAPPADRPTLQSVIGTVLAEPLPPPVPVPVEEPAIRITAGLDLGVAAYAHDGSAILVFDQRIPIDPAQFSATPGDGSAGQVQFGADSTILTVPWPADMPLSVRRRDRAWLVATSADPVSARAVNPVPADRRIELPLQQPGRVVTIIDPLDGRTMLIGTSRGTDGGRAYVPAAVRAPEYTVLPSVLGVVIEPLSDTVDLRQTPRGFAIAAADDLTPAAAQAPPPPTATRRFDLPALPTAALARRLQAELAAAAAAPPRARAAPRLAAAQSLISLGFGMEAQSLLTLTAIEDPAAAANPDLPALGAIGALLAGRPGETQGLDNPALDGSDEVALWRALRAAWRDGVLAHDAALLPVALGYPAALRARVLPVLADAAAAAGDDAALALIDASSPGLPGVQLAQATRLAQSGPPDAALAILDGLVAGPDRRIASRAAIAAAELRLQAGQITPAQAAEALERQGLAWRGDAQEVAVRQRVTALRVQAGLWRPALEGLRDLGHLAEPSDAAARGAVQDQVGGVFRAMLAPDAAPIPPLDFVALVAEFTEGLPAGQELTTALADKLMALDLPLRARSVLTPLLTSAPPGPVRAGIGARIAQLALDGGAAKEAEAALTASEAPGLPPALTEQRVLLAARARAARDDRAGAVAQLAGFGSAASDDLRATLLAQAGDWPGALLALNSLAAKAVPAEGPLPDAAQDIVLRQATAAVNGNDAGALTALRNQVQRMDERRGGVLRLLTAPPVTGSVDIVRAGQELALSREVPLRAPGVAAR